VGAAAPEGCWISQWRVYLGGVGRPSSLQGVLNDGNLLAHYMHDSEEDTIMGEAGGSFTAVQGR
jgi:hypothetical protein